MAGALPERVPWLEGPPEPHIAFHRPYGILATNAAKVNIELVPLRDASGEQAFCIERIEPLRVV